MNPLLKVIDDYKKDVAYGIKLFHKKYGEVNLLREWRKNNIPQVGKLSDTVEYQFHGIGCNLDFGTHDTDFNFGDNQRYDGFDLWRITLYIEGKKVYTEYNNNEEKIKNDFQDLIDNGIIVCSHFENDRLCYLKEDL
jgi:hypothetical protein